MIPWLVLVLLILGGCSSVPPIETTERPETWRDSWGIPHIVARSVADAFREQGFRQAEDRLWQMEVFRRAAKGELAEIIGEEKIEDDLDRRSDGYTEDELRKMFESSSERMRSIVTAYCEGANAFIAKGKLPPQFAARKLTPRPWTETDCLAIGIMMARRFGEAGDWELQVQAVYTALEKKFGLDNATTILRDLVPDHDPYAVTTLNDYTREAPPKKDERQDYVPLDLEWYAALTRRNEEIRAAREALGIPTYSGSNAWVVAPNKSASGRPILYGGPMMGFNTPSICNEVQVSAPGLNVAGMSFPGVPGVMIGFNERVAWTTTSGGADVVDVYILELNPDNPEEYRYKGQWLKFDSFDVEIKIAGQAPRKEKIRRSRYGPVIEPIDAKRHVAYTKAMSFWMGEQGTFDGVLDLNFATGIEDARRAVSKIVTSHNFFAADRDGHIGFWYCGAHPVRRKGHDPRLPQKGDGSMDWEGIMPFEKWPQSVDPPDGFFGNWNNKPVSWWEPSQWGKVFWGRKIIDTLEANEKLSFEQVQRLARDAAYFDFRAAYFAKYIVAAAKGDGDENVVKAAELLSKYDCVNREGRPEPVIVDRWMKGMLTRIFEVGPFVGDRRVQRYLSNTLLYLFEKNGMVHYDFLGGRDLNEMALEALREVVKGGVDKLAWKDEAVEFGEKMGRIRSSRGRGTFQMTVELSVDGQRAETLAAPGQSESEDSPHYADQVKLFEEWRYKPFAFQRSEIQ